MAYFSTASASERRNLTGKNRVWDFFRLSNETHPANRRQPLQPRRKIGPTAMKTASGIPCWPSRDPIGEKGGLNLYGFVGNDGVGRWDLLGYECADTYDLSAELTNVLGKAWQDSFNPDGTVVEQGGDIVSNADGSQEVRRGEPGNSPDNYDISVNPRLPDGKSRIGTFHTHPYSRDEGSYTNVTFSCKDISGFVSRKLKDDVMIVTGGDCIFILKIDDTFKAANCTSCCRSYDIGYNSDPNANLPVATENGVRRTIRHCGICYYKACKKNGKWPGKAELQNENDYRPAKL